MYRPKFGPHKGQAPAITVPRTLTQVTYLNKPLVEYFNDKGIDRLSITVDTDEKTIKVRQAKEGEKGYRIVPTGKRGFGISQKLRQFLPAGRYELTDKRRMLFVKAV